MNKTLRVLIVCISFFYSCRHQTVLPPDAPQVSYNNKIRQIITANCTATCHEHTGRGGRSFTVAGNDTLIDTNKLKKYIQPGSPGTSQLYTAITKLGSPMPPDSPMPEGNIILIYTWIKQGAKYAN